MLLPSQHDQEDHSRDNQPAELTERGRQPEQPGSGQRDEPGAETANSHGDNGRNDDLPGIRQSYSTICD